MTTCNVRWAPALVGIAALTFRASAGTPPPGFTETPFATIGTPTAIAFNPLTNDLWMCSKGQGSSNGNANIRVRNWTTGVLTTALSLPGVDSTGERGALGIAFDPDFATNHYVYIYYTAHDTVVVNCNPQAHNRVSRFVESGGTLSSETVILEGPPLTCANNHNGGQIRFGLDGKLYVAMGDNANPANAQTLANLLGKILRINKDGTVPPDNPFVGQAGARPEIWAYGLRNPWRFSVHPDTGTLYIADVGQVTWEEVDIGIPGANYGWSTVEGPNPPGVPGMTYPTYWYHHSTGTPSGCSIIGGVVYTATAFPADFRNNYYFGDYCQGWIYRGHLDGNGSITSVEQFLSGGAGPTDFAVGPDGCLYYASLTTNQVYRECYTGGTNQQPTAVASGAPGSGLAPLTVAFSSAGSADPDGDPLSYAWVFGDGGTSTAANPSHTYTGNGAYNAVLTVNDGKGQPNSTDAAPPVRIVVGNRAPTATIVTPPPGTTYDAGDTISYSGLATDPEDGTLAASAFTWLVTFHHGTHVHPFLGPISGQTSGSFVVPTSGEAAADTWFQIQLTVQDSGNPVGSSGRLTDVETASISPNLVNVTMESRPPGLDLELDNQAFPSPQTTQRVVNFPRTHGAPGPQTVGSLSYAFSHWSDGGPATHTVVTPAVDATYRAQYFCTPATVVDVVTVEKASGGQVTLSWSAAPTSCHGGSYRVYEAATPVPAAAPGFFPLDPSFALVGTTASTQITFLPGAGDRVYLVVSIDGNGYDGPSGSYP